MRIRVRKKGGAVIQKRATTIGRSFEIKERDGN